MAKNDTAPQPGLKKVFNIAIILILIAATVSSLAFYYLYTIEAKKNTQDDATRTIEAVGKLMDLPLGEVPTVATVTDKSKLQNQPLLNKAENGDRVIIYTKAQKAILYRPSSNKIIDVVPVNPVGGQSPTSTPQKQNEQPAASPSATITPTNQKVSVILLNGTEKVGLTTTVESQLTSSFPNIAVIDKDDAKNKNYEKTVVVIINQKISEEAKKIASSLGATLEKLPESENEQSTADMVIILGKDRL